MWALVLNDAWLEETRIFAKLGPIWYTSASILNLSNMQRKFIALQTRGVRASYYSPLLCFFLRVFAGSLLPFFCGEVLKDSLSDAISRLPRIF